MPKYEGVPKGKKGKNPDLKKFWKETEDIFWQTFTVEDVRAGMPHCSKHTKASVIHTKTNQVCKPTSVIFFC